MTRILGAARLRKDATPLSSATSFDAQVLRVGIDAFHVRVVGAAAAILLQLMLARTLPPEEFGVYAYSMTWLNILVLGGVMGLDNASVRFIGLYVGRQEWGQLRAFLAYGVRLELGAGIVLGAALGTGGILLRDHAGRGLSSSLVIAGVMLPVMAALQVQASWLQGFRHAIASQFCTNVLRPLLFGGLFVLAIAVTPWRPTAAGAMSLHLAAAIVALAVAIVLVIRVLPREVRDATPSGISSGWLRTALALLLMAASQLLLAQADVVMVGAILGTTEAGTYAIASQLADVIIFGINAANVVLAPAIAELHGRGEMRELQRMLTKVSRGVLIFSVPVALALMGGGYWILGMYGGSHQHGWAALNILALGELTIAVAGSVGFLLTMTGNEVAASRVVIVSVAINIVLNGVLIPAFGLVGAACATLCATVFRTVVLSSLVRRRLGLNPTAFSGATRWK